MPFLFLSFLLAYVHGCQVIQTSEGIWLNHSFPCITFQLDQVPELREEWQKGGTAYNRNLH